MPPLYEMTTTMQPFVFTSLHLIDLQPQDRVVIYDKTIVDGERMGEEVMNVEAVDHEQELVHVRRGSGRRLTVRFDEIQDIQKCENPIMAQVSPET